MARKAKPPEELLKQFGTSVDLAVYEEIKAIAREDPYERQKREPRSVSATTAFLIRVGLCLYRRSEKPLYQLMNELEASDVETHHDHAAGERIHQDRSRVQGGAPTASRDGSDTPAVGVRSGPPTESKTSVRRRTPKKR